LWSEIILKKYFYVKFFKACSKKVI
jgi:hypothetical protein